MLHVVGDVRNKHCIIVDDIVDTAGTLTNGARALLDKKNGAKSVSACCSHGVLSGPAIDRITSSSIEELVVTDTIILSDAAAACGKIRNLSVAGLLAEAIERTHQARSVSELFL